MSDVLYVYKPEGMTPLEAVARLKEKPEYARETLSYAGRLDPLADGVLVVLVGEANKRREKFEGMKKAYRVVVLLGAETDTYDPMGLLSSHPKPVMVKKEELAAVVRSFQGVFLQEYPPYSSKAVHGKPLYYWARRNRLHEITIPTKKVEIYSLKLERIATIEPQHLLGIIKEAVGGVKGDFRQAEIIALWDESLRELSSVFQTVTLHIECSSGTYMRSLAHTIGKHLGVPALALHITRERVGEIGIEDCISL